MRNKDAKVATFPIWRKYKGASAIGKKRNGRNLRTELLFVLLLIFFYSFGALECSAQALAVRKTAVEKKDSIMPFKSRLAVRTNAIDWLCLLPNVAVEFDLTPSCYNKITVGMGVKWNWETSQKYLPSTVYNLFDARLEVRRYWRTELSQVHRSDKEKVSFLKWLREDVFTRQRQHPRYWRAYYWGVYTNLGNYSFKFGEEGVQGYTYGAGLSAGFGIPLYGYKNHFVDLELGGSVGCVFTRYDRYGFDAESNCYPTLAGKSKGWHVLPYPVITDLRVAFVYRFASIKDKYKLVDHVKQAARHEREMKRKNLNDSINEARRLRKEEKALLKKNEAEQKKAKAEQKKSEQKKELGKEPEVSVKQSVKPEKEKRNKKKNKKGAKKDSKMEGRKDENID